jgi:XTP/dITP diphosphohydrolase
LRSGDDPEPLIAQARWPGLIVPEPRGAHGFGYDPYFLLPDLGQTAAELAPDHKTRISHRGQAMAKMARKMADVWDW